MRFAGAALPLSLAAAFAVIVYINLLLAAFNLIPFPPLDGSKVLQGILSAFSRPLARGYETFLVNFQRIGILPMTLVLLALFYLVFAPLIGPFLSAAFGVLTGKAL